MPDWKSQIIQLSVPFKILSAAIGAVSYCWQINFSQWLFYDRVRPTPFSWDLVVNYPLLALLIGGFMGYISAIVLILWCKRFYQTASFIAFSVSSWCIGLGMVFICFVLFPSRYSMVERVIEIMKLLMVYGMPFFWGLILQVCARRLRRLSGRIET